MLNLEIIAIMSSSEGESSTSFSNKSYTSEVAYNCQFRPYEGEPLVHPGEYMGEEVVENDEDEDGLTPSILAQRFDRKVKVDSG